MEFLLLIYGDEKEYFALPKEQTDAMHKEYWAFGQKHAHIIKGGNALLSVNDAKTVRVRNGKTLTTDGPFAETKEQLGGYYLIDAPSVQDAIAAAAQLPGARNGSIEVRPIMKIS
jgi:hypothetical protein